MFHYTREYGVLRTVRLKSVESAFQRPITTPIADHIDAYINQSVKKLLRYKIIKLLMTHLLGAVQLLQLSPKHNIK